MEKNNFQEDLQEEFIKSQWPAFNCQVLYLYLIMSLERRIANIAIRIP